MEYHLFNVILRPEKGAKNLNIHYYPILYGCMNSHNAIEKSKNFQILLNIEYSFINMMVNMTSNIRLKKYISRKWQTQTGNFTTDQKVKVDFFLTKFSVRKIVT